MFLEAIKNRIEDYNKLTNMYKTDKTVCQEELNSAIRSVIISITILMIVYLVLLILAVYYAFKCSMSKGWSMIVPILLVLMMFVPGYGGVFTIGLVVYGMLNCGSVCDVPRELYNRL